MEAPISEADLPGEVAVLALRLGADGKPERVHLTQRGGMTEGPGKAWMRFEAIETIDLAAPAFHWRARTGPLSCLTVIDRLSPRETRSELRLLGMFPLVHSPPNEAALLKGQVMRYLAEIPWAPDAILRNRSLRWDVGANGFGVSCTSPFGRFAVDLELDADGRIISSSASDRPRIEGSRFVERAWQGRFSDYRQHCSRWIPFRGEVGWVIDGLLTTVWRAELTDWRLE